jgi:hypothetical protein
VLLTCLSACWLWSANARADHQTASESSVKSAFLYKFTHFVDWPPESLGSPGDPLAMCVMGRDELTEVLEHAVDGRSAQNHPLVVRRIESAREARECHLLFIGWSKLDKIQEVLGELGQRPTLTVGDVKGFASRGGMINLMREGRKLRFEINRRAAERAGIRLSSQLLKLAKLVE